MILLDLFITFAKIGVMTFGGGYAMLPMFKRELVEKNGWITDEELMDYYAISQCTPGVIAVNCATFVGYKKQKTLGALAATLGVIFPALIIITVIAAFIKNFADLKFVKDAFAAIRVCVCVLILNTIVKLWKQAIKDWKCILIYAVVLLIALFTNISKIFIVILAAVAGILICHSGKETDK